MSIIGSALHITREPCTGCDVRAECLTYALNHNEPFGVWGGLSERERHRMNRARRAPRQSRPPTAGPKCGTPNGIKSHARRGERACDTCLHAARGGAA